MKVGRRTESVHAVTLDAPRATRLGGALTFAAVAEEHLDDVYGYLLYLCRNATLAEDLAGDTFEKALKLWRRFDPTRGSARTWLLTIARSTALDWFRAEERRRRREQSFAPLDLHEDAPHEGLSPEVAEALATLTAGEREVIALRVVLDLDGDAAARVLGISQTACSTRLSRALKRLEERMADHELS
jgi:RNA polymerase sigma-70 factor (ECF subfamily)